MNTPEALLNRRAITTPSDSLSPEAITRTDVTGHADYSGLITKLKQNERIPQSFYLAMKTKEDWLIEKAFAKASGREEPCPQTTRGQLIESLTEDYRVFGLAAGPESAEVLLRGIEAAAARQAMSQRDGTRRI